MPCNAPTTSPAWETFLTSPLADSTFFSSHFSPNPNLSQMAFRSSFNRAFLLDEPQNSIYEFKTEQMQPENV